MSTYHFSTLYTTLPHNLIKEKLLDLIERTFKNKIKKEGTLSLACNDKKKVFTSTVIEGMNFALVRMYVTLYRIFWIIFTLDLCSTCSRVVLFCYEKDFIAPKSRAKVCAQWRILNPPGSLLATDRSKAVVLV